MLRLLALEKHGSVPWSSWSLLGPASGESQPAPVCLTLLQPSPRVHHPSFLMVPLAATETDPPKQRKGGGGGRPEPGAGICSWWEPGHTEFVCSSGPDIISFLLGTVLSSLCVLPWHSPRRKRKRHCPQGTREGCQVPAPHVPCGSSPSLHPLVTPLADAGWDWNFSQRMGHTLGMLPLVGFGLRAAEEGCELGVYVFNMPV